MIELEKKFLSADLSIQNSNEIYLIERPFFRLGLRRSLRLLVSLAKNAK